MTNIDEICDEKFLQTFLKRCIIEKCETKEEEIKLKTFFGSTFINKKELEEANINYPIKLEYYKIINEDELIARKGTKFGINIIKTEYRENAPKIEEETIKYLSNDEQKVDEILESLKCNEVTPIALQDIIIDFSKQILFL